VFFISVILPLPLRSLEFFFLICIVVLAIAVGMAIVAVLGNLGLIEVQIETFYNYTFV
jgi:hypothetical protein